MSDTNPSMLQASQAPKGELPALRQIRESAQALLREGKTQETWELLLSSLEAVLAKSQALELLVAKLQRSGRSSKSERIDPAQLQLLFQELIRQSGQPLEADPRAETEEDAALEREIAEAESRRGERKQKASAKGPDLQIRAVERQTHKAELPQDQRCPFGKRA